jgi:glycine/D-amino acid oxidase-like deaminating enzyme
MNRGRLEKVETSDGAIAADTLVLARGAAPDVTARFADSDVPQRSTPGIIAITAPMPRILNRIVVAPGIHMHQRDDRRVVMGEQAGSPQTEAHALRLETRPTAFPESTIADDHAARMLNVARHFAPQLADATVESIRIGWRPLPLDGHPVIGASPSRPDVYIAIMHSGVTLAPIVGQLAAAELMGDERIKRLDMFRPGREFAHYTLY